MSTGNGIFGLTGSAKSNLLSRLAKRAGETKPSQDEPKPGRSAQRGWADLPGFAEIRTVQKAADTLKIVNPFFRSHDGVAGAETEISGRRYLNFSSYDYLGLNSHPQITAAAVEAIHRYGTSVSASRMVSGERPIHRELELALAAFYQAEDAVCFVSGHATNVSVVGHIMKPGDLIVHDELIHNSALQGALLSGARRQGFRHNDVESARRLLSAHRGAHKRALLIIEGQYSMDGDIADLPGFLALAREFDCWLMVDEAHALGVLGDGGHGLAEHFGIDPAEIDIWMGTLSKTLVSCGGYIAGKRELIEYLKCSTPGFVYSVGMAPAAAAASRAALALLQAEPERVTALRANAARFLKHSEALGLDTGRAAGASVVPLILGSSAKAARLSEALFQRGINVQPILYPAVPERAARLRFFLSASHTGEQIDRAAAIIEEAIRG